MANDPSTSTFRAEPFEDSPARRGLQSEWVPPEDMEEAEARKVDLVAKAEAIQTQLGDQNRLVNGVRMEEHEWWTWRRRACGALGYIRDDLRRTKQWIQQEIQSTNTRRAKGLISGAFTVLARLQASGVDIGADGTELLERFRTGGQS